MQNLKNLKQNEIRFLVINEVNKLRVLFERIKNETNYEPTAYILTSIKGKDYSEGAIFIRGNSENTIDIMLNDKSTENIVSGYCEAKIAKYLGSDIDE